MNGLIRLDFSGLRQTRWYEYGSRFLFGGIITVLTGVIAHEFGPTVGGLFLAFPAIFPASASLIDKHQREKKEEAGADGVRRGRKAAALDAIGSAMGTAGLGAFAVISWKLLPRMPAWIALTLATAGWVVTATLMWYLRKRSVPRLRRLLRNRKAAK